MEYVALDFETANKSADSACSIGLSLFNAEGEELDSFYSLICPEVPYFDPECTAVHALNPYDILNAPKLSVIWPDILSFIGKRPLVAHNASFDIKVLKESAETAGVGGLDNDYYCTLSLSRKLLKDLPSKRLSAIAEHFNWRYNAHDAGDDAYVCGLLFSRLCGSTLLDERKFREFITDIYSRGSSTAYPKRITIENSLF